MSQARHDDDEEFGMTIGRTFLSTKTQLMQMHVLHTAHYYYLLIKAFLEAT